MTGPQSNESSEVQPAPSDLPTSSLAYLFADFVAPLVAPGKSGQRCWASGSVVESQILAVRLGMIAVLGLREDGVIALEPYEGKKLMVKVHGVRAHLLRTPQTYHGVENRLLTQWFTGGSFSPTGEDVGQGFSWIPTSADPHGVVLAEAINDVVAYGCLVRVPAERGVGGKLLGKPSTRLEPVPPRIEALRGRAEALRSWWTNLTQAEQPLCAAVEKTIVTNIGRRQRRDDDNSWDSD